MCSFSKRSLSLIAVTIFALTGCATVKNSLSGKRDRFYVIKNGDTLETIGNKYGIDSTEIKSYNGMKDSTNLKIGQKIVIPAVGPLDNKPPLLNAKDEQSSSKAQLRMVSIAPVRAYIGQLEMPIEDGRYTSKFGWRWRKFHEGMDLSAPEGTPVLAAHDGTVVLESDSWGRYGKVIVIKGEGLMTVYGHNSVNQVKQGAKVRRGQQIAKVGQTGNASGPHLHFETRILDEEGRFAAVNPTVFYP
jgi:murein DD-endopeptidase MepM/ murein hydrolase activator NlpD